MLLHQHVERHAQVIVLMAVKSVVIIIVILVTTDLELKMLLLKIIHVVLVDQIV